MANETIRVEGDETLRRTMATAGDQLEDMDQDDSARLVQQRAAARAPKLTGTLAGSLNARDLGDGKAAVESALIYAPVIHYGWAAHNITPQPFLTTALADSTQQVESASVREANRILSHVKGA